jgi:hypothetical protein
MPSPPRPLRAATYKFSNEDRPRNNRFIFNREVFGPEGPNEISRQVIAGCLFGEKTSHLVFGPEGQNEISPAIYRWVSPIR